jgi:hypothetical protein
MAQLYGYELPMAVGSSITTARSASGASGDVSFTLVCAAWYTTCRKWDGAGRCCACVNT